MRLVGGIGISIGCLRSLKSDMIAEAYFRDVRAVLRSAMIRSLGQLCSPEDIAEDVPTVCLNHTFKPNCLPIMKSNQLDRQAVLGES
jgi:hypothetical protein